ncbi:MAG: o-succinylbenzoate synthase [Massilibacteroides sp.]|nr:o-succinylbenzoate synthase [Massilibacteroides sp.]MDD3061714.1 o-succinylbenzoate synthase [Massilibacteroides sp.]MDD4114323.1 o-succinylbenzoate synthase [Massilibacteroides sp.]MDD4660597.1 o-succinylbenzoate synthase [Massilibacteroides sp.]
MFQIKIKPYTLHFRQPAGTSRGVYTEHHVWYVIFTDKDDPSHFGIGECAPLPDLSSDYSDTYAKTLSFFCRMTEEKQTLDMDSLRPYPSVLFGLETGLRHYRQQKWEFCDTPFTRSEKGIPINGLIWMGDFRHMYKQIDLKLKQGFKCLKLKIGAIEFKRELELLRMIRKQYSAKEITLRVDANGNFDCTDALAKLNQLAELDVHSIEQPIRAGQWEKMAELIAWSPLPVALDEELIGINNLQQKRELLKTIRPKFIVLKPSLHGGLTGTAEWIELAREMGIGWWVTSALESNIGLNCISQWCSTFNNPLPQGLGTGMLYTNNIDLPLTIRENCLWIDRNKEFPEKLMLL